MSYLKEDPESYGMELKNKNKGDPINTAGLFTWPTTAGSEYIFADPEIFTEDAQKTFFELPANEQNQFIVELLDEFYRNNPEYANFAREEIYKHPRELLKYFKHISPEDFTTAGVLLSSAECKDRYQEMQRRILYAEEHAGDLDGPEEYKPLKSIWPVLRIRNIFTESELAAFYYLQHPRKKRRGQYITEGRTKARFSEPIPERLAIITRQEYKNALLAPAIFKPPQGIEIDKKGHLKIAGDIEYNFDPDGNLLLTANTGTEEENTVKLVNVKNDGIIENIDLPNLNLIFTIMKNHIQKQIQDGEKLTAYISIDAYELAEALGTPRIKGKEAIRAAQDAIYNLVGYVGVLQNDNAPGVPNEYSIINYWGIEDNQIKIESPYFVFLLSQIFNNSMRRDPGGNIEYKTNGEPLFEPYASYLIHTDIVKERDRAAIENVKIITQLIETAGSFTPHISARELINRNTLLAYKIEKAKDTRTKNIILKRVFSNTWKYINKDTDILTTYNNLKLPVDIIPNMQSLDIILEFPNSGKPHNPRR